MHPFHSLFTEEPETEYIPDILGRLGQGETVVKPDPEPIGTPSPRFNEFIKAEQSGMGLRDLFGANPFAIKGPVGPTAPNRRADVGKVETFLSRTGNHDLEPTDGPTGYYGLRLEDAINAFQKANGLKTDGLVRPFGETIRTLASTLKDQLKPPSRLAPLTPPGLGVGQGIVPLKHSGDKHPETAAPPAKDPLEAFRKADRESMKRLEVSRQPKPTHREAERTGEQRYTRFLEKKYGEEIFKAEVAQRGSKILRRNLGIETGINVPRVIAAMKLYLSGKGGVRNYDPKWILNHPIPREAAKRIEGHFAEWMIGRRRAPNIKTQVIGDILRIKDGQTMAGGGIFEGNIRFDPQKDRFSEHSMLLGKSYIKGKGNFTFTRKGNIVEVTGVVEKTISDPFDFHPGTKFEFKKYRFKVTVDGDEMIWLATHGKAKPFEVRSVWRRKITWRLRIVRDPATGAKRIVGVGRPQWSDAK